MNSTFSNSNLEALRFWDFIETDIASKTFYIRLNRPAKAELFFEDEHSKSVMG